MSKNERQIREALDDAGYENYTLEYVGGRRGWILNGSIEIGRNAHAVRFNLTRSANPNVTEKPEFTGLIDEDSHPEIYDNPMDDYGNQKISAFGSRP
jgi:hypothetical protein